MYHSLPLPVSDLGGLNLSPMYSLPVSLTPLLGREREQAHLLALLQQPEVRLLTITGPGGVGKTHLLLEVAHTLSPELDDICFVPLDAISDPAFVVPAIGQALGRWTAHSCSSLTELQAVLGEQSLLLLLDNFEHVLAAAPSLSSLLRTCPRLRLLVSSRAPLRLQGEHEFALSPLSLPQLSQEPAPEVFAQSAAFTLFVQRVQAIQPEFTVTRENARSIAEICVCLDGLPLSIELAAARTRLLSPQALLVRLCRRLTVLMGGMRDGPLRQQTLRATLAWSYDLLSPTEQQCFRQLAVFAGGCSLQAAESIVGLAEPDASMVIERINRLVENHLVHQIVQADGETRLRILETIREYGLECLERCGELEATQIAHAAYYLTFAEQAAQQDHTVLWPSHFHAVMPHLPEEITGEKSGAEPVHQTHPLEREQENLRAALGFLLARAQDASHEVTHVGEQALRLCVALSWFWHIRGLGQEGLSFLMQALSVGTHADVALRARGLYEAAELGFIYARHLPLEQLAQESVALYRELDDPVGLAHSLSRLGGIARIRSQFIQAQAQLEEAASLFQALGNHWRVGQCWTEQARAATEQGHYEQARTLLSRSLALYQKLGDQQRIGWVYYLQARLLWVWQQDLTQAYVYAQESLASFGQQDDTPYHVYTLGLLGLLHLEHGEFLQARSLLEESLALGKRREVETDAFEFQLGLARLSALQGEVNVARCLYQKTLNLLLESQVYQEGLAASLEGLATLEAEQQNKLEDAARLWGAAQAVRETIGAPIHLIGRAGAEQAQAQVRAKLGASSWHQFLEEGRGLSPHQVLAAPVSCQRSTPFFARPLAPSPQPPTSAPAGLTTREVEVLRCLAQGWTDSQIAQHLVISPRTVNRHTTSLYSKLGVCSRAAATRSAIEYHLL